MSKKGLIGTSVPNVDFSKSDADLTRKEKIAKEQATKHSSQHGVYDEHGRQRFHGAFTGGFSAGYYNTVGSKEGFTPKSYYSSRDQRAPVVAQSITDFMDEEDMQDMDFGGKNGRRLQIASGFSKPQAPTSSDFEGTIEASNAGVFVPFDLLRHGPDTVGYRLLKSMGWSEGRAVGPKRLAITEEDERMGPRMDTKIAHFHDKNNSFGLGFNRLNVAGSLSVSKKPALAPKKPSRLTMGSLADDDEDDLIYGTSKGQFNTFLAEDEEEEAFSLNLQPKRRSAPEKPKSAPKQGLKQAPPSELPGFVRPIAPPLAVQYFPPPKVPSNFNPMHRLLSGVEASSSHPNNRTSNRTPLTAAQRSHILEEEETPWSAVSASQTARSVFSEDPASTSSKPPDFSLRSRFTSDGPPSAPNAPSTSTSSVSGLVIPSKPTTFLVNPALHNESMKQARYQVWAKIRRGEMKEPADGEWRDGLTAEERKNEQNEFAKRWTGSGQIAELMSKRFTSSVDTSSNTANTQPPSAHASSQHEAARIGAFGKMTRSVQEWAPNALLCKRMNVLKPARVAKKGDQQGPSPNAPPPSNQATRDSAKALSKMADSWKKESDKRKEDSESALDEDTSMIQADLGIEEIDDNTPLPPVPRPPMDLFKSIFELDDEEDAPLATIAPVKPQIASAPIEISDDHSPPPTSGPSVITDPNDFMDSFFAKMEVTMKLASKTSPATQTKQNSISLPEKPVTQSQPAARSNIAADDFFSRLTPQRLPISLNNTSIPQTSSQPHHRNEFNSERGERKERKEKRSDKRSDKSKKEKKEKKDRHKSHSKKRDRYASDESDSDSEPRERHRKKHKH